MCIDLVVVCICVSCFFFQAEDGIRDLVRSRGLGDVYKRQGENLANFFNCLSAKKFTIGIGNDLHDTKINAQYICLLYTSDAADERSSVDLGGRRIIKKKTTVITGSSCRIES